MRRGIFYLTFLTLIVLTVGGFIFLKAPALAAIELSHDGTIVNNPLWQHIACQESSAGYLILKESDSLVATPEIDFSACSQAKISFKSRTYGGVSYDSDANSTSSEISLWISSDGSEIFQTVFFPATNQLTDNQFEFDLSGYCGRRAIVSLKSQKATGSKGVGLDDINIELINPVIINTPPVASATVSSLSALVDEEIFFDGSQSFDLDGMIIDWLWDFGTEIIRSSTTRKAFSVSSSPIVSFSVVDNLHTTSSQLFFNLSISDPSSSTISTTTITTTTPPTTSTASNINPGDIVINEIYPAPLTGEKEWIELFNNSTSSLDLSGLILLNLEGGKWATTTLSGILSPGQYLVLEDFSGSLNNSGDTVVLKFGEIIISQTTYGNFSGKSDQSWSFVSGSYYTNTIKITKGLVNIIELKPITSTSSVINNTSEIATTSIDDLIDEQIDYAGMLIINEVFPDPENSENPEFIELKNVSTSTIDLRGFYLSDATDKRKIIKGQEPLIISAGGLAVIWRDDLNIALNNSGFESVNLYDPDGFLIDKITYQAKKNKNQAYARNESGEWLWTSVFTPGAENVFDSAEEIIETAVSLVAQAKTAVKKTTTSKNKNQAVYTVRDFSELSELSDGTKIKIRGVVTVVSGVLGSQFFYISEISNLDNSDVGGLISGLQVYSYKKDFPELVIGDLLEITGELSTASVGRRLKISSAEDIKKIETNLKMSPAELIMSELSDDLVGSLLSISGEILEIKGRSVIIADGDDELEIYFKSNLPYQDLGLISGQKIKVSGILTKHQSGWRFLPRSIVDVEVLGGEVKGDFAIEKNPSNFSNVFKEDFYLWSTIIFLGTLSLFLSFKSGLIKLPITKNRP